MSLLPHIRQPHPLSVAPMIDWTDRHCRYFHRLIAPRAVLYTEMITTGAIIHGGAQRYLAHDESEHPLVLQLGGSDPGELAEAVRQARPFGFDAINLNVGCPSDRVLSGRFGACLMAEPALVAELAAAMLDASEVPVTIKTRIGIDDGPVPDMLDELVDRCAERGVETFVIHARKAWLNGLSPKENREIPPLSHETVHALARRRPDLSIHINGGITEIDQAVRLADGLAGVMLGRKAYQDPLTLAVFENALTRDGPAKKTPDPFDIVEKMAAYAGQQARNGTPLRAIARHMLGLFNNRPGARRWRRMLGENMHDRHATADLMREAAALVAGAPSRDAEALAERA
ncbi:MAG: tRNA dihydrouridine(20/20a) synthase DusA [Geminicoccaceae bacterium]